MRKKYGIFIIILILLLAGLAVTLLNKFYSFDYLYNFIIKREFVTNPRVEIVPDKEYQVRIWYYPFYRTIKEADEQDFFQLIKKEVEAIYPNIRLFIGEVDFATGEERLREAIKEGNPPDIYFNLGDQVLISEKLQVPVSPYISTKESAGYYTVDWHRISHRDKLWGWPVLVQKQAWVARKGMLTGQYNRLYFQQRLGYLEKGSLFLNYYDETLLKQLLTLVGLDTFKLEKKRLDIDSYRALEEVFTLLHQLKEKGILYNDSTVVPDIFLKEILEGKSVVIGPVNPYLSNFINKQLQDNVDLIYLDNLVKTYELNIFRQRNYKGDDHTRAVMEVARIISQRTIGILAKDLGLGEAYLNGEKAPSITKELLVINPEYKDYWNEVVLPLWLEFWEKGLRPEEVMSRF